MSLEKMRKTDSPDLAQERPLPAGSEVGEAASDAYLTPNA
jgi:hypothetical protein